jgi:putative PIN family toxin of toxin-antitoxin system
MLPLLTIILVSYIIPYMRNIVIDTNVIISSLQSNLGASHLLMSLIGRDKFNFNISVPVILEYEEVCLRKMDLLGLTEVDIKKLIDYYCSVGISKKIFFLWRPFLRDFHDDMMLELAFASGCDSIITYNIKDFANVEKVFGIKIVTPKQFLFEIGELKNDNHQP